ncbi:RNA polymerase-associated protein Leo1p [Trichomonascus vanleenenianus]|uniref:Paf1-complex subunit LEO1 n=1 Tax=Trichomonascus vanleenenianus TaxID=2268995 RepID=UPI003ECABE51
MSDSEKSGDDLFGEEEKLDEEVELSEKEEEEEEEEEGQKLVEVTIPRYPPSHAPSSKTYFVRVPKFLNVDAHPFNADKFVEQCEKDLGESSVEEKTQFKLKSENTVRWKYGRDDSGNMIKQSNARFVKWSDGSMSLQLGEELFDVYEKPYEDTFLTLSHPTNQLLQATAMLSKAMTFVPTSTKSLTHKRITEELAKQRLKGASVGNVATIDDPEKIKREAEKAEETNLRARRKLENKRKQLEERGEGGTGRSARYDYGDEDDDLGVGAGYSGRNAYEEDDFVVEDEEEEEEGAKRLASVKKRGADKYKNRDYDDEEEEEEEAGEDELDELDAMAERAERRNRGYSDEEEEEDKASRKKRRVIDYDEDDE